MGLSSSPSWLPDLEDAIERDPLTILPTAPLDDAIALLSQLHQATCPIVDDAPRPPEAQQPSCLLVVDDGAILGILTERDIVQLTVQTTDKAPKKASERRRATVADIMVKSVITLSQSASRNILSALFIFRRYRIHHLPIVDDREHLVGLVTYESIRRTLRPINLLRLRRVSEVMTRDVERAPLSVSILRLAQLMVENQTNCVVITQPDAQSIDQPVGLVTQRDIVELRNLQIDLAATQAWAVMRSPLFLLRPEDSLWRAYQEMQQRRVSQLVVSWNWGRDLGLLTQTSLLSIVDPVEIYEVIEALQQTLEQVQAEPANPTATADSSALIDVDSLDAVRLQIERIISNIALQPEQMRSQIGEALRLLEALYRDRDSRQ